MIASEIITICFPVEEENITWTKKTPRQNKSLITSPETVINKNMPKIDDDSRTLPKLLARIDIDLQMLQQTTDFTVYNEIIQKFDRDLVTLRVNYKNTYCGKYIINMIPKVEYYTRKHRTLEKKIQTKDVSNSKVSDSKKVYKQTSNKFPIISGKTDFENFQIIKKGGYEDKYQELEYINKLVDFKYPDLNIQKTTNFSEESNIKNRLKEISKEIKRKDLTEIDKSNLQIELGKFRQVIEDNEEYFKKDGTRPVRFDQISRYLAALIESAVNIENKNQLPVQKVQEMTVDFSRENEIKDRLKEISKESKRKDLILAERNNLIFELEKLCQEIESNKDYFTKDGTRPVRFNQIENDLLLLNKSESESSKTVSPVVSKISTVSNEHSSSKKKRPQTIWKYSLD